MGSKNTERCKVCDEVVDTNSDDFTCTECMCPYYAFNVDHNAPLDFDVDDSKSTYIPEYNGDFSDD